jgi:hypothetical protein
MTMSFLKTDGLIFYLTWRIEFHVQKQMEIKYMPILMPIRRRDKDVTAMKAFLEQRLCECFRFELLCQPDDGVCTCGILPRHEHCKHCGGVKRKETGR